VEPNIYLRDEVAIKVGLEVSNITQTLNINGTVAYQLGTRNAATVLQIKDGETQILAGLIQDDDRMNAQKVPWLGDIPIVGRLFRNQTDDREKTEIILLITPRIVRTLNWPQNAIIDTPVGTDSSIGSAPLRIAQTSPGALALAPAQAGGAARQPAEQAAAIPAPTAEAQAEPVPGLLIAVPLAAKTGTELLVSLGVPPGVAAVGARLDLAYDPSQLQPIGVAPSAPGRLPVKVEGATSVRFKLVATQGTVQVRAENVVGVDAAGANVPMQPPAPVDIAVTP